jgi:ABC-2 type transport system ATP-binding protein
MDQPVAVRILHLTKRFGQLVAVDDLSLEIRRGEVFGLLGPNGAGKTTTVNMCVGLLAPDSGSVELDGAGKPTDADVRARIGVAPQSIAIYDELTAQENLEFFARLYGLRGAALGDRARWALEFVGLAERARDRVQTYSGGMKRRLNLAAGLVHDPELLICDEPTVGVDPQSRNAILERILELKRLGRTVIYTSHYMDEVERICDRVGIIDHGRLLALDTVDGLIRKHGGDDLVIADMPRGEVRIATREPLAELQKLLGAGGLGRFRVERPDLEQVFLNLTGRTLRE